MEKVENRKIRGDTCCSISLNTEPFYECVLSSVKLVVSVIRVRLKTEEIRILVILRMSREFNEYMRVTYPNTPLSDFKSPDVYVKSNEGLDPLEEDQEDQE